MRTQRRTGDILTTQSIARTINLLLLILFPAAWLAPLAEAGVVSWWSGDEITIYQGVIDLWQVDMALAGLVAFFAIVVPYLKTIAMAGIHFERIGPGALPMIEAIGKLSMADIFLIALYVVVVKGVGVGHVETSWGLWLFTGCVMASLWVGWITMKEFRARALQQATTGGQG